MTKRERGRPPFKAREDLLLYGEFRRLIGKGLTQRSASEIIAKNPGYDGRSAGGLRQRYLRLKKSWIEGKPVQRYGMEWYDAFQFKRTPVAIRMLRFFNAMALVLRRKK